MVYFDNAATSFPKTNIVAKSVEQAVKKYGGNPGRSGHKFSFKAAELVFDTRQKVADFFKAEPESVVFTLNCTHALNIAIKGLYKQGGNIITTELEHNSVLRPLYSLSSKKEITFEIIKTHNKTDAEILNNFKEKINNKTCMIISTHASNVTGQIMPIKKIYDLARLHKIPFIVDTAQTAGILPIHIKEDADIICMAGHKGLYGPTGTGLMVLGDIIPRTLMEGGTGNKSLDLNSPPLPPERFEPGTVNTVGIAGLGAGIDYIKNKGIDKIHSHEQSLCSKAVSCLSKFENINLYTPRSSHVPIVLFNFKNISPSMGSKLLSDKGFALRSGIHCAPLAHKAISTLPEGAIRFSPSMFNSIDEVNMFCRVVSSLAN